MVNTFITEIYGLVSIWSGFYMTRTSVMKELKIVLCGVCITSAVVKIVHNL